MIRGKKTADCCHFKSSGSRFAHFLESLDRLIAMNLLEVYETEEGLQFRFVPPLEADQFFANVAYQKLLEKKIGEVAVRDLLPEKPEGEKRKVNFASVFGIDGVSTHQRKHLPSVWSTLNN